MTPQGFVPAYIEELLVPVRRPKSLHAGHRTGSRGHLSEEELMRFGGDGGPAEGELAGQVAEGSGVAGKREPNGINGSREGWERLQILELGQNCIASLPPLMLGTFSGLLRLGLADNKITGLAGLSSLPNLMVLDLDCNLIQRIEQDTFQGLYRLQELGVANNRLRRLSHLEPLCSLRAFRASGNRLATPSDLQALSCLISLSQLDLSSNPCSKKMWHKALLMEMCPSLRSLDGLPLTPEDRLEAPDIRDLSAPRRRSTQQQQALARKQALKMTPVTFDEIVFEEGGAPKSSSRCLRSSAPFEDQRKMCTCRSMAHVSNSFFPFRLLSPSHPYDDYFYYEGDAAELSVQCWAPSGFMPTVPVAPSTRYKERTLSLSSVGPFSEQRCLSKSATLPREVPNNLWRCTK
eukprot:jgi/Botrbrau1/6195/Bobra.0344s0035.1